MSTDTRSSNCKSALNSYTTLKQSFYFPTLLGHHPRTIMFTATTYANTYALTHLHTDLTRHTRYRGHNAAPKSKLVSLRHTSP